MKVPNDISFQIEKKNGKGKASKNEVSSNKFNYKYYHNLHLPVSTRVLLARNRTWS